MKPPRPMRSTRALRTQAPLVLRRDRRAPASDATTEPAPGPTPEAVFDRVTGPYGARCPLDEEP